MDNIYDPLTNKLGEALLKEGIITENQLRHALQEQMDSVEKKRLGPILIELGYVSSLQIREVSRKYNLRQPMGELLVENGYLSNEQLNQALKTYKSSGLRLGEYLTRNKLITEEQMSKILSLQMNLPYIVPNKRIVDKKLMDKFSIGMLKQYSIIPIMKNEEVITLVVHDPLDRDMVRTLRTSFKEAFDFAIGPKSVIDRVINEIASERTFMTQATTVPTEESSSNTTFQRYDLDKSMATSSSVVNAVSLVDYIISNALNQNASDIHIESMYNKIRIRHRLDGQLLFETDLPKNISDGFFRRIKVLSKMDINETTNPTDGHIYVKFQNKNIDMRVSSYPTVLGPSITIRFLSKEIGLKTLEELGMLPRALYTLKQILDSPAGLIIFAGPTGSGKTTSLYACLNYLNHESLKICTIESPVEYSIEGVSQCQTKAIDKASIGERVKSMLHQDPDVMVIGEITDEESSKAAVDAALTGHKVFTTIHTDDSFVAVMRLMEMGMRKYLLSSTGLASIAQRLLRRVCHQCKEKYIPDRKLFKQYNLKGFDIENWEFSKGKGCQFCNQTGFMGRTGLFEILTITDDIRNAFLENQSSSTIRKMSQNTKNYLSLREAGFIKALQGETTIDEAQSILSYSEKQSFESIELTDKDIQYWMSLDKDLVP